MTSGQKIIDGLRDAVKGDLPRVTIDGVTYVRQDVDSPEDLLANARGKIAELYQRVDVLEVILSAIVYDVEEYERINNLHPNPERARSLDARRIHCWRNITRAKEILGDRE